MFYSGNIQIRYLQVALMFTGMAVSFILRVNMSVAIVPMAQVFGWNEKIESLILSSFFWGYITTQMVFGNLAEKYGAKQLFTFAVLLCSSLTIAFPFLAVHGGVPVLIAVRIAQGILQSIFVPCTTIFLAKWVPPKERGRAYVIAFNGLNVGTVIGLLMSGLLAGSSGGWPSIFYVTGSLGLIWAMFWIWMGASKPEDHKYISAEERQHIQKSLAENSSQEKLKTPWLQMLTSVPVWTVCIAHFGQVYSFWTLLTCLPSYMNSVLTFDIQTNGILSSLPYIAGGFSAMLFAALNNKMRQKNIWTKSIRLKFWNSIGLWGCCLPLFWLAVSNTKIATEVVIYLVIAIFLNSAVFCGFLLNHVELASNFCGSMMGLSSTIGQLGSIIGPLLTGWIVDDETSTDQWKIVFLVCCGVMFITNLIYVLLGTSDIQPWNNARTARFTENGRLSSDKEAVVNDDKQPDLLTNTCHQ